MPRASTLACAAATAALAVAVLGRPLLHGVSAGEVALFWTFVLLYVVLPGLVLLRALRWPAGDPALALGVGAALGLAAEAVAFLLSRSLGAPGLFLGYPLLVLPLLRRRAGSMGGHVAPTPSVAAALLAVAALAALIQPLVSDRLLDLPLPADHLFHAGNAAEVLHRWPPGDPRVAGQPMNYHYFGYALAAGASQFGGLPVARVLFNLAWAPPLLVLLLQVFNASRRLGHGGAAGAVAAALVALHADVGAELGLAGGFLSYLGAALYGSTTTVNGMVALVSLFVVLHAWLETGPPPGGAEKLMLALFAFVASGTKGTVMPVFLSALGVTVAVLWWRERARARRLLEALAVCVLAAAPMTLVLALGGESYRGVFRVVPGALFYQSGFYRAASVLLGATADASGFPRLGPWVEAPLAAAWFLGYLGPAAVLALVALGRRGTRPGVAEGIILAMLGAGALAALTLHTWGASQLFFLYDGQLLLAAVAGGGAVAIARTRPRGLAAAVLAALALPLALRTVRAVSANVDRDLRAAGRAADPLAREYREALDWLRRESSLDSLVVLRPGVMLASTLAERRALYETGFFTARGHSLRWLGVTEPFPGHAAAAAEILANPRWEPLAAVLGPAAPAEVYVLRDNARLREVPGWMQLELAPVDPAEPAGTGVLVYANAAARVYRLSRPRISGSPPR